MLDENQRKLYTKFSKEHWLGKEGKPDRLIEWVTFYRRNLNVFVEHYLGIKLYWYQAICLYLLNLFGSIALVASRASAKSFMIAIFACAKAMLYPNSKIVIASSTKKQAALIVTEKIQKELIPKSKPLASAIKKITKNNNETEVTFRNNSSIVVVPANDNSRGFRSTVLVLEEFRQIKKNIVDSVLKPFQIARPANFRTNPETGKFYEHLIEEPTNIYISSSGTTSDWMWQLSQTLLSNKFENNLGCILAMDYSVALKHGIKTKSQLLDDKNTFDPITWRIEYENEMLRENMNAFFTYKMLEQNQRVKKCFYPRRVEDVLTKTKNPYAIKKQPNEIRIVSCDFAFVDKKENDNSVFSCIRLIPESAEFKTQNSNGVMVEVKSGYRRIVPYLEANKGGDVDKQAIRIKQLFEDFDADYVVLDARNGGILVYDRLAKILYDEERDCEYKAWTCMNDDDVANRIKIAGALPIVYVITATQKLNSSIALSMREVLVSKKIDLLINKNEALDDIISNIPEYSQSIDLDTHLFYERPYLETQALIAEMISLEYERGDAGVIKIHEVGSNTKDRYTSVSYGSYFAGLLEQDLLSDHSEYEYCTFIN